MKTLSSILFLSVCLWLAGCKPAQNTGSENAEVQKIRLFEGDNPDPAVVLYNGVYYMVHSSFDYCPGLVVYQSTDLVNWTPSSAALKDYVGAVWAPDICVHNNRFYIYFPAMGANGKKTNMVVWADSPNGPWSEPVDLKVGGIDPEHVVGEDGRRYVLLSAGDLHPLSEDGLSITGEPIIIYKGWEVPEEWDIESFSFEGLNLKKIGDYYYILAAQGGTAGPPTGHMVVQARSRTLEGPWENSPSNPLLRTESRNERWWSQGHGQIIDGVNGELYMTFHAYEKDYLTLGRQTLICEVKLDADGWLQLKEGPISLPSPTRMMERRIKDFVWQSYKESIDDRATISSDAIVLKTRGKTPLDSSPLLLRSGDHSYEVEACLEFDNPEVSAGLIIYYNNSMNYGFGFRPGELVRFRRGGINRAKPLIPIELANGKYTLWVKIRNTENLISGWYSADGQTWRKYPWGFDMQGYHHNTLGEFLSLRPGIVAMGGEGEVKITGLTYRTLE
ncbi:family 43 glycosylhydrolase [Bacteroides sp. 51]|uniref:family 43 glycosylhydrolase n=1 Tax=Bacteroides sp. 51 TaxID=2302938 RepID=UPI0013D356AD|nr:family 43 glycosylhydrolase [Bacteroides sp. 51]NDV81263.1 xylan 1,4-beta-xylosidase [Bacteroides sp. 51]